MALVIDGSHGPYHPTIGGWYGRNTARAFHELMQSTKNADGISTVETAPLRYSLDNPLTTDVLALNALGHEVEKAGLLGHPTGYPNPQALAKAAAPSILRGLAMGAKLYQAYRSDFEAQVAEFTGRMFPVLDRDHNGVVDPVEMAANTIFLDDPTTFLAEQYVRNASGMSTGAQEAAQEGASAMQKAAPTKLDGQITVDEKSAANEYGYERNTTVVGQVLDRIITDYDLYMQYAMMA